MASGKQIEVRGVGLAVKLYRIKGLDMTATKLAALLRDHEYAPEDDRDITSGFVSARKSGDFVNAEFAAGFTVSVSKYDKDGNRVFEDYVSVDNADIIIKVDRGTIELRGPLRVAGKFLRSFMNITDAVVTPLNLDGGTRKLFDRASEISSVILSGVEKGNLKQAEFSGEGIQTEEEIGLYTRRYNAHISRFRGKFDYPSKTMYTTYINAPEGSFVMYRRGKGINEDDLNWLVELMEESALGAVG